MSFFPAITAGERARVVGIAKTHMRNCEVCSFHRRRRKTENNDIHRATVKAILILVTQEHEKKCYTCKVRGEAAMAEHRGAIIQLFYFNEVLL